MSNLIKINNIAVGWMEGHFHGEDVQMSECPEKSFAAMKEICELSKYPNPDETLDKEDV